MTTTITDELVLSAGEVDIQATGKPPAVTIVAYTGGLMSVPGWGPVAIDLAGEEGDDVLEGGAGDDDFEGGVGTDRFITDGDTDPPENDDRPPVLSWFGNATWRWESGEETPPVNVPSNGEAVFSLSAYDLDNEDFDFVLYEDGNEVSSAWYTVDEITTGAILRLHLEPNTAVTLDERQFELRVQDAGDSEIYSAYMLDVRHAGRANVAPVITNLDEGFLGLKHTEFQYEVLRGIESGFAEIVYKDDEPYLVLREPDNTFQFQFEVYDPDTASISADVSFTLADDVDYDVDDLGGGYFLLTFTVTLVNMSPCIQNRPPVSIFGFSKPAILQR